MSERMIRADGIALATQSFGDPARPTVLLIMGGMASMLWWPQEFCERLASRGRHVIRYDQRDTGLSTTYEPGQPGYTGADLRADAIALLDAYGLPAAHLVGVSSGGALVQLLALELPSRVLSLVLISTSPALPGDRSLPGPSAAFAEFARSATVDWSDAGSVIHYLVTYARVLAGEERRFDEAEARDLVRRDVERADYHVTGRGGWALIASVERQPCFDNAFVEVLTAPRTEREVTLTTAALHLLCERLGREGTVACFAFSPTNDPGFAATWVANGFRRTGTMPDQLLVGGKRCGAFLWTRKLTVPTDDD